MCPQDPHFWWSSLVAQNKEAQMKRKDYVAKLVLAAFLLSGCASIVGKNMYPVTINSHPDEAIILIKDESGKQIYKGKTPTTITLSSGEAYFHAKRYSITFSKEGYENQTTEIKAGLSGWYFGNILFGGLIGLLIVDPITGNMWKLPAETTVTLGEKVSLNNNERNLQIVSIDQIPAELRNQLIRLK